MTTRGTRLVLACLNILALGCQGIIGGDTPRGNPSNGAPGNDPAGAGTMPSGSGAGGAAGSAGGAAGSAGDAAGNGPGPAKVGPPAGRIVRRMSADQIRAAFVELTGFAYEGRAWVRDPLSSGGYSEKNDADLLDLFGSSLGRPDYDLTVHESLEAGVSFAKFVEDAARSTCGRAAQKESKDTAPAPKLLLRAKASDALPAGDSAIRANLVALALRFWGQALDPQGADASALVDVFRAASMAPAWTDAGGVKRAAGAPMDGWRAVCIALTTDPQFFVY